MPNDHGPSEGKLKGMWEQFADPKGKGRKNKGKVSVGFDLDTPPL